MKKKVLVNFFQDLLQLYEFELMIDIDEEQKTIFKLKDLQDGNLGNIEGDKFYNLADIIERLDVYHNDYIYEPLDDRESSGEIIKQDDWDLTAARYIESDWVSKILRDITPIKFKEIIKENTKTSLEQVLKFLNEENEFYKTVCEKYVKTTSKEMLFKLGKNILHVFIDDDYINLKTEGKINEYNYENYMDGNYEVHNYNDYEELFYSAIKNEILSDLNDLSLFNEKKEWDFYINFEELKKMELAFMVQDNYPLLMKYALTDEHVFDFFQYFSLEQLDDFEHSLYLYWIAHDIIADEDMTLVSKENYLFNSDIIRLSCGLISYEDFMKEYQIVESSKYEMILPKVIKYFKENCIETLKEYGNDGDEGLYHLSDLYKELMNQLNIKFKNIYTEDKEPGEYTTYIDFDTNSRIGVNTKSSNDMEIVIDNLIFISCENDNWLRKQNEFEYDYE